MKVLITKHDVFTSKKGVEWHNLSYVNVKTGDVGNFMITTPQFNAMGLVKIDFNVARELIDEDTANANVEFTQKGYVESASPL